MTMGKSILFSRLAKVSSIDTTVGSPVTIRDFIKLNIIEVFRAGGILMSSRQRPRRRDRKIIQVLREWSTWELSVVGRRALVRYHRSEDSRLACTGKLGLNLSR